MLHTKFMLFAVVALMAVGNAVAIVGGRTGASGKFPYFALLKCYQLKSPFKLHSCGGTLITKQYVLTAAHCLAPSDGAEVILDVGNLKNENEIGRETFNVKKTDYRMYPQYDANHPFVHDIALVKLPLSGDHTEYIRPVQISCSQTPDATDVLAMGYGRVSERFGVFATSLQYTILKTIDLQECISNSRNLTYEYTLVCAKGPETSICEDDDGGPLVSAKTGKLIGIAGHANGICTLGSRHVFTGIGRYIQWIEGIIDDYICKNQKKH